MKFLKNIGVLVGLFASINVMASECGLLELKQNRSSGAMLSANECDGQIISKKSVLKLAARGRFWLNPVASKTDVKFNLLCQNKTRESLQFDFSDSLLPWLNISKLNNCSGWVDNRLRCEGERGEKNGLVCVFSVIKKSGKPKQIERTTSVKMRGFNYATADTSYKEVMLAEIRRDLKLCKKVNDEFDEKAQIHWMLEPNAPVRLVGITLYKLDDSALADCAKSVVLSYPFTRVSETQFFTQSF